MRKSLLLLVAICVCIASPISADDVVRRKLSVALYPYIPELAELYWGLEQAFEDKYPQIDLRYVDTGASYYKSQPEKVLKEGKADVVEVDTVLLADLVEKGYLEPLSENCIPKDAFLPVAEAASKLNGRIYGVPHWVCGNFLFFRNDDPEKGRFEKIRSLNALERLIGRPASEQQTMLVDLRGKSTLGEKFLDAMIDLYGTPDEAIRRIDPANPDPDALKALDRLFGLCPGGLCDSDKHHEFSPFYARQFAERRARAFVGYSERLHFVIEHGLNGIREDQPSVGRLRWDENTYEAIGSDDIGVVPATLSDTGSTMLTWVDVLSLRSGMAEQTRKDAISFIEFFNSEEFMTTALVPQYGHAPRYLLPARISLYSNASLVKAAPLYPKFLEIMKSGVTATGLGLNEKLRAVGKAIEDRGFTPLR